MPAKAQPMAAITKDSTTAGPALSAAAMPVRENSPAPMMAPMPRATRLTGPRVLARWCLPLSDSSMMRLTVLIANRLIASLFTKCARTLELRGFQKILPFYHPLAQFPCRGSAGRRRRIGEQAGNHGHGIRPGVQNVGGVFQRDPPDGHQRLVRKRAQAPHFFDAHHRVGVSLRGGPEDRAERHVVHGFAAGRRELAGVVAGEAENGLA